MTPLLIKFASRSRPRLFAETFARWNAVPAHVRFCISLDEDDEALPAYLDFLRPHLNASVYVDRSSCKVEAINRDVEKEGWPWGCCVVAADDMIPQRTDYAAEIDRLMSEHFPDTDGVLHLNDGRVGERCNTMPAVGRLFWERMGRRIFHEEFVSVYCDEELTEYANGLSRSVYVPEVLIRHAWIEATGRDPLHKRNEDRVLYQADCETLKRRRAAGFPYRAAVTETPRTPATIL